MGRARLQLALQTVEVDGKNYEIRTTSSRKVGGNHKKRNLPGLAAAPVEDS